jgi:hypothetical protein
MVEAHRADLPERIGNVISIVFLVALGALFGLAYFVHFFG